MTAGRTLFLHIGHGKTGSSFLQSCFALSRSAMGEAGVAYPMPPEADRAERGGITSGNGAFLRSGVKSGVGAWLAATRLSRTRGNALVSNEDLFWALSGPGAKTRLAAIARRAGFTRVEILLFIRDPFDHLPSFHQQRVKRGGFAGGIDQSARVYRHPLDVARFLELYEDQAPFSVTLRNYSRRRAALRRVVENWIGLPHGALLMPEARVVNRGLSQGELELQRRLNRRLGRKGSMLADRLCEALPQVRAAHPHPSAEASAAMALRLRSAVDAVNGRLSRKDSYRLAPPTPARGGDKQARYTFTAQQLEVIADVLGEEVTRRPLRF